jgi:hypothetical protein
VLLSIAERRRTLSSLDPRRFAGLGAAAGAASASMLTLMASSGGAGVSVVGAAVFLGVSTAMGAACAALTLKLARSNSQGRSSSDPGEAQRKELVGPSVLDDLERRPAKRAKAPMP